MSGEHGHPELGALDGALGSLSARVAALTAALDAVQRVRAYRDFTGKATDERVIPAGGWQPIPGTTVKGSPFDSPDEKHLLYARLGFDWLEDATGPAIVEVRYVRGDGDATAYDERHFWPGTDSVPLQQPHFEVGAKGVGGSWEIRLSGGLRQARVTTRYAKLHAVAVEWVQ